MSDTVRAWLDHTDTLAGQATGGAWEWVPSITTQARYRPAKVSTLVWGGGDAAEAALPHSTADAAFIAHARTALPAAVAALRAVAELHAPFQAGRPFCRVCTEADDTAYTLPWPCPTITAITDAIGDQP